MMASRRISKESVPDCSAARTMRARWSRDWSAHRRARSWPCEDAFGGQLVQVTAESVEGGQVGDVFEFAGDGG